MTAHLDLGSVRLKAPTFFLIQRPLVLAGSLTDTLPHLSALRPGYKADRTSRFPVIRIILQDTTEPPLRRLKKRAQLPAYQSFHPPARNLQESVLKMPLVVPQATTNDWEEKLLGKKIGDSHDNVTFAKQDLPEEHRIVKAGEMVTQDHKPERLNIHVDDNGTVHKVVHG
ncbi:hypothetical protein IWZ00DRAFT_505440 [Phyllosticta capitalensis]